MTTASGEIVNPRTGERVRFLRTARETHGKLLRVRTINPRGPAEPEHIHPRQESSVAVLAGVLHCSVSGRVQLVRVGDKVVIPPGTPHRFWNEGEETHLIQEFRPALRTEELFRTSSMLTYEGKTGRRWKPSLLYMAILSPAFGEEIRPASLPWPVFKLLLPLLTPIARWRGYRVALSTDDAPNSEQG